MSPRAKRLIPAIIAIFLFAAVVNVFIFTARKVKFDSKNRNIQLVYYYEQIKNLAAKENYPVDSVLKRLKALGVNVIALKNLSFEDWLFDNSISVHFFSNVKNSDFNNIILGIPKSNFDRQYGILSAILKKDPPFKAYANFVEVSLTKSCYSVLSNSMFGISLSDYIFLKENGFRVLADLHIDQGRNFDFGAELFDKMVFFDPGVKYVFFRGKKALGFPSQIKEAAAYLASRHINLILLEFYKQDGLNDMARAMPDHVVRAHELLLGESNYLRDIPKLSSRLIRALKERSVNTAFMHIFNDGDVEDNFSFLRLMVRKINRSGFNFSLEAINFTAWSLPLSLRRTAAFAAAFMCPIISFYIMLLVAAKIKPGLPNILISYFLAGVTALFGGVFTYSILWTNEFAAGIYSFTGVKAAFLIPLAVIILKSITREELKAVWGCSVKFKHIILAGAVGLAFGFAMLRSGNSTSLVFPYENILRDWLDSFLGVRPRFKEFMIGHPLLITGLWLSAARSKFNRAGRFFVCAGFIGQISIINTFLHVHTPIQISLARSVNGLVLGAVFGLLIVLILKRSKIFKSE